MKELVSKIDGIYIAPPILRLTVSSGRLLGNPELTVKHWALKTLYLGRRHVRVSIPGPWSAGTFQKLLTGERRLR